MTRRLCFIVPRRLTPAKAKPGQVCHAGLVDRCLHNDIAWEKVAGGFPCAPVVRAVQNVPVMTIKSIEREKAMSQSPRVAIITGASSGIGAALARRLVWSGYRVGLVARRLDRLEALQKELGDASAIARADVGVRQEVVSAIQELASRLGPVDLLIANAGVGHRVELNPMNVDQIEKVIRVNLLGVIYSLEAVLPAMLARHSGHLAAISSVAAFKGMPGESAYCASKAGLGAFMEGLRIQLRGTGVAVTTVNPGFVKSEMTAGHRFHMPFLLETDEAARRMSRALEAKKKVFSFPWQTALLMRLSRFLPDALFARVVPQLPGNREEGGLG
jgi:short-subunit dehydrogenase